MRPVLGQNLHDKQMGFNLDASCPYIYSLQWHIPIKDNLMNQLRISQCPTLLKSWDLHNATSAGLLIFFVLVYITSSGKALGMAIPIPSVMSTREFDVVAKSNPWSNRALVKLWTPHFGSCVPHSMASSIFILKNDLIG